MTYEKIPEDFLRLGAELEYNQVPRQLREWAREVFEAGERLNIDSDTIAQCIVAWGIKRKFVKPHIRQVLFENGYTHKIRI